LPSFKGTSDCHSSNVNEESARLSLPPVPFTPQALQWEENMNSGVGPVRSTSYSPGRLPRMPTKPFGARFSPMR